MFFSIIHVLSLFVATVAAGTNPNIVIIVMDDVGFADVGYQSVDFADVTPTINELALNGIILNNFIAASECTPSRAQLLTGRYSLKLGLQDSVIHGTEPRGVSLSSTLLSDRLKTVGYNTAAVGKWHLGFFQDAYLPINRGFDYFYGILNGGGDHYTHTTTETFQMRRAATSTSDDSDNVMLLTGYNLFEDDSAVTDLPDESVHSTVLYSGKAVDYITNYATDYDANKPFFLYLAYQAVHGPLQADKAYKTIRGCESVLDSQRNTLCGMMGMVDDGINNVVQSLSENGYWDNTLLFFLSDNGGSSKHGSYNTPFSGEKGDLWEGGIRTPAFISGGYLDASVKDSYSTQYNSLFHLTDISATVLNLVGGDTVGMDGINLWQSLISDNTETIRNDVVYNINSETWGGSGAIRSGDYKYIVIYNLDDTVVYEAMKEFMRTTSISKTAIDSYFEVRRESFFGEPQYYLFNVAKNVAELDSEDCDDVEACTNLFDNPDFAENQQTLQALWKTYLDDMTASSELLEDDGPLANPVYFGGSWNPWRDVKNIPYCRYDLV